MLKIAMSFDYELFLGENYFSSDEILFKPTKMILDVLKKYNVDATFFADVCCAIQHRNLGVLDFCTKFNNQLLRMIDQGNDVQLHIHPNWLTSKIVNQKWIIDKKGYRLHDFGFDTDINMNAFRIIEDGIQYLNDVIKPNFPDYKCVAYRAGGYSIQPHNEIVKCLRKNGIYIDSSVCQHKYCYSNANNYDFRTLPKNINWWLTPNESFDYEGNIHENGVFEVPLCSDKNNLFDLILKKSDELEVKNMPLKGSYIKLSNQEEKKPNIFRKIYNYQTYYSLVSLDTMSKNRIIEVINRINKKYATNKKDVYISIICHPKLLNEYVLKNIEDFICYVIKHEENFEFVTFTEIYKQIVKEGCD